MLPLLRRQLAQGDGPGDVRGALVVLSAGVHQVEPPGLQNRLALLRGGVVAHGRVGAVGGDGVEAGAKVALLLPPELLQPVRHAHLVHGDLPDILLQPVDIFRHRDAVLDVGAADIFHLHRILHRLGQGRGVHPVNHPAAGVQVVAEGVIHAALLHHHRLPGEGLHVVVNAVVGLHRHTQALQVGSGRIVQGLLLDEQQHLRLRHRQVGENHRIAGHVVSADIQQPDNVVQGRQHMDVRPRLSHSRPKVCDLFRRRFPAVLLIQDPHRLPGEGRAIRPDHAHQILAVGDLRVSGGHSRLHLLA